MYVDRRFETATKAVRQILAHAAQCAVNRGETLPDTIDILRAIPNFIGTVAEVALRENEVGVIAIKLDHESRTSADLSLSELSVRCVLAILGNNWRKWREAHSSVFS